MFQPGQCGQRGQYEQPRNLRERPAIAEHKSDKVSNYWHRTHCLNKYYFNRLAFWFVVPSRAPASQCPHCLREFTNLRHHINQQHMQVKKWLFLGLSPKSVHLGLWNPPPISQPNLFRTFEYNRICLKTKSCSYSPILKHCVFQPNLTEPLNIDESA